MAKSVPVKSTTKHHIKKQADWTIGLFLALTGMLVYANTLGHQFALDDFSAIKDNFVTKQGFSGISTILTTDYRYGYWVSGGTLYRPVSLIMFAIEWALFPDSPFVGHFVNVVLYGLTIYALFRLLSCYIMPASVWLSTGICLLFATHPIHTEVVANIKSRDEILGLLFCLTALISYMKSFGKESVRHFVTAFILFTLAMFSKESAITFLAIFPLTAYFFTEHRLAEILKKSWYLLLPVGLYLLVRQSVIGGNISLEQTSLLDNFIVSATDPGSKFASAVMMLGYYLKSFLFPVTLSHEFGYNQIPLAGMGDWRFIASLILHLGMFWYIIVHFKEKTAAVYGLLFYLITISVVSNVFITIGTSYGERLFYTPGTGLLIFFCAILYKYTSNAISAHSFSQLAGGFKWPIILFAMLFSMKTFSRNAAWYDSYTLYHTDIANAPNSAKMTYHYALETGKKAMSEQDPARQKEWRTKAIELDLKAIKIYPKYNDAFAHLGLMYYHLKDFQNAEKSYKQALALGENDAKTYSNMGTMYSEMGNANLAMEQYKKAVNLDPRFVDARRNLGCLLAINGQFADAIKEFDEALKYEPQNADIIFFMGSAYRDSGNPAKGNELLEQAYRLKPELRK